MHNETRNFKQQSNTHLNTKLETTTFHEHDISKWKTTKMGVKNKNLLDYGCGDFC